MEVEQELRSFGYDEYEFEDRDWGRYDDFLDKYDIRSKRISSDIGDYESYEAESIESLKSKFEKRPSDSYLEVDFSQLERKFLDIYKQYPVPKDPGLDKAFWILYPSPPVYKADGIAKFFDLVKLLKLSPITCLKQQLRQENLSLKYYGIDPEAVQALAEALISNHHVKTLDLQDNWLTADACYHLNKLLLLNPLLRSLSLANCKIGVAGATMLLEGISNSFGLRELDLSGCELGTQGIDYIGKAVAANTLLQSLNISKNNLKEESAIHLQKMLNMTVSLEKLNLSWNDLYTKHTCIQLFNGLLQNSTVTDIDMSWNSMGKDSLTHLCNFITRTRKIKRLNLSANRFIDSDMLPIARAILLNNSLEEIELNKNPLGSRGITGFIRALNSDVLGECSLKLIDLEYFWATKDVLPLLDQLQVLKPDLVVKLGGILSNYKLVGPDLKELYFLTANYEAMNCKIKEERRNFGHFVLSLEDKKIRKAKFEEKVDAAKIQISEDLVNEIMKQFLVSKKVLDQAALKESYLYYFPDTKLPPPPPPPPTESEMERQGKKKKKGKKDKKGKRKKGKKGKKDGKSKGKKKK